MPAFPKTDPVPKDGVAAGLPSPLAVVVMGVSGSGKSTVGSQLAAALGGAFVEGDLFHDPASIALMRAGHALTDDDRWPWLDRVGAAMRQAMGTHGIAVAACSALKHAYRERLAAAIGVPPRFVLLAGSHDELLRRLEQRPGHYMPACLLDSQLATLEPPGRAENAITLDAAQPPDRLCRETIAWLEKTG